MAKKTEEETKNEAWKESNNISEKLWKICEADDDNRLAAFGYQNEHDLQYNIKQLKERLVRAAEDLNNAGQYLMGNKIGCLNDCGILQSANHDIDTLVTLVKAGIKTRSSYRHLYKEEPVWKCSNCGTVKPRNKFLIERGGANEPECPKCGTTNTADFHNVEDEEDE